MRTLKFTFVAGFTTAIFIVCLVAIAWLLIASRFSGYREVDIRTIGFRLADGNIFLFLENFYPDRITPERFAGAIIVNSDFEVIEATSLSSEMIDTRKLSILANLDRSMIWISDAEGDMCLIWDNNKREFVINRYDNQEHMNGFHQILRRYRPGGDDRGH